MTSRLAIYERSIRNDRVFLMIQILLCSFLIALCAQISIHLPFTPVPITLQTFAVMLVGGMLGSRNGALCIVMYIAESMLGLPVLQGGVNPLAVVGPTGGYILGFVVMAYLSGWFFERQNQLGRPMMLAGLVLAVALELSLGALWLGFYVGFKNVLWMGVFPFIPGDILKIIAVTTILVRK